MAEQSSRLLPAVAVLIVLAVGADVARRALARAPAPEGAVSTADTTTLGGAAAPVREDSIALVRRRDLTRQRLELESGSTYLNETVRDADSTVRRWPDERNARPLKVAIMRQQVDGFREEFMADVAWAVGRWNGSIPVGLVTGADSADADIVIVWTSKLDGNRAGRTDLTWDRRGHIRAAFIVLATHSPDDRLLDNRRVSSLALHELGHALGLNHSPDRGDVLHAVAYVAELSERDRRTARVLYELPTGSIR